MSHLYSFKFNYYQTGKNISLTFSIFLIKFNNNLEHRHTHADLKKKKLFHAEDRIEIEIYSSIILYSMLKNSTLLVAILWLLHYKKHLLLI